MEFESLLELVGDDPLFETSLLMAGNANPENIRQQLSRWTKSGRLYQLRRGLYVIAPPYQKTKPHPFLIANRLQRASYISTQSALAFYGLIPDTIQATTSVTAGRPERSETPFGLFIYRHVKPELLSSYQMIELFGQNAPVQQALIAKPEKALLDLVYLQPGGDQPAYLQELRLQNLDRMDIEELTRQVEIFNTPKLRRAAEVIIDIAHQETQEYRTL